MLCPLDKLSFKQYTQHRICGGGVSRRVSNHGGTLREGVVALIGAVIGDEKINKIQHIVTVDGCRATTTHDNQLN